MRRSLFDSPIKSRDEANDTVPFNGLRAPDPARAFLLFVPGWDGEARA
jgi:hypothetical protein